MLKQSAEEVVWPGEAMWLGATESQAMLALIRTKASDRKLRLFACACCVPLLPLLGCDTCNTGVTVAENVADGNAEDRPRFAAREHAWDEYRNYGDAYRHLDATAEFVLSAVDFQPHQITHLSASAIAGEVASEGCAEEAEVFRALSRSQPHLLRCIFGNPFRPVAIDPRWRSETAVALASAIYAERAFDRLPILADALEEAGCDHAELLAHCRGSGPHVRGCWAVDLVLGKV